MHFPHVFDVLILNTILIGLDNTDNFANIAFANIYCPYMFSVDIGIGHGK